MNRRGQGSRAVANATNIILRGVPRSATSADIRRALLRANIKGVSEVAITYRHFRPTTKALLTMSLPDYTDDALRAANEISISGSQLVAERVYNDAEFASGDAATGDGPFAGTIPRRTVTLSGFAGRTSTSDVTHMLKGFDMDKDIIPAQLPPKKFSLFCRFAVLMGSESEAQRLVRQFHMTPYKNIQGAPIIRAEIIY